MSVQLIIIPEYFLHETLELALKFLRDDWAAQSDKDKSYLRRILYGVSFQRYGGITQAEAVFVGDNLDNPRFLEVDLMWNMDRNKVPAIHVTMPAEQAQVNGNGIGLDQGYIDSLVDDEVNPTTNTVVFTRRIQASYNIVITSDNSNEVVLIYHVMRALLISMSTHLAEKGIQNLSLGGGDLQIYPDNVPKNLYMRTITVGLQYETSAPNIFTDHIFKTLTAIGTPVNS